jgi:hypothetical protein
MVYQAPREKCLQIGPTNSVFDPLKVNLSVGRLLSWRNLPNNTDFPDSTRGNAKNQETL